MLPTWKICIKHGQVGWLLEKFPTHPRFVMSTVLTAQARRDAEAAERARAPALEDRSPRPPGEEDEGPDPVVDPVETLAWRLAAALANVVRCRL